MAIEHTKLVTCDRCLSEIGEAQWTQVRVYLYRANNNTIPYPPMPDISDVCPDCAKQFSEWWKRGRTD